MQTSENPHGAAPASRQGQPTLLTGGMEQYHDAAYDGYLPTRGPSIYPDTVPGPVTDQAGLTDELRRAIQGRGKGEEGGRVPTRPAALPTVSAPASSSNVAALGGSRQEYRQVDHGHQHPVAGASQTPVSAETTSSSQKPTAPSQKSRPSSSSSDNNDMELKDNLETMSRLGEGASGEVRKARHKVSGVVMAVKVRKACSVEQWLWLYSVRQQADKFSCCDPLTDNRDLSEPSFAPPNLARARL